jgi:choline dehydrogenase
MGDLNDLDAGPGVAPAPFNVSGGIRWNAAFAFLDPVRSQPNLTIRGDVLVDRVLIERGRAAGAVVIADGARRTIRAERVVLTAGTYGSPIILLRSGIGDPAALARHGIAVVHALPGVGLNLHDHPAVELAYTGSLELEARTRDFAAAHFAPAEQVIAKAHSSPDAAPFDLHLYPVGGLLHNGGRSSWHLPVAVMTPVSRGEVALASADPDAAPVIRHGYLADAAGHDLRRLADGVELVRRIVRHGPFGALIGEECAPSRGAISRAELEAYLRTHCFHYYHPVGTCKMGGAHDAHAVVDARGAVHGLSGLYVADASVMPVIPRANTNVPTAVVASRIAGWLAPRSIC